MELNKSTQKAVTVVQLMVANDDWAAWRHKPGLIRTRLNEPGINNLVDFGVLA